MQRKAIVLDRQGRVWRTPPGSKRGACHHRGHSGTWENQPSPGHDFPEDEGYRVHKSPGADARLPGVGAPETEPEGWKRARYRTASAT